MPPRLRVVSDDAADGPDVGRLIDEFLRQAGGRMWISQIKVERYEAGKEILALPRSAQAAAAVACVERLGDTAGSPNLAVNLFALNALAAALLRKTLPLRKADIEVMLRSLARQPFLNVHLHVQVLPIRGVLRAVEGFVAEHGMPEGIERQLRAIRNRQGGEDYAEQREVTRRIDALLAGASRGDKSFELTAGEPWTDFLNQTLAGCEAGQRGKWIDLLQHAASATSSKPSKRWLAQSRELIDAVTESTFVEVAIGTLSQLGKPGKPKTLNFGGYVHQSDPTQVHDTHADLLRGLVWCASLVKSPSLIQAVGDAAEICFKKIPGVGPRSPKIGNACLWSLSATGDMAAVAQLSRLKTKAKHASIKKQLGRSLNAAADAVGMSQADLEEVAVPAYGLSGVGRLSQQLGEFTAEMTIEGTRQVELRWTGPSGKPQKSVPAAVKQSHAAELKALKKTAKDIGKMLPAQRDRIEQLYLARRHWRLADWRQRYLDHPLVGTLARRLIWTFAERDKSGAAIWHDGKLLGCDDRPLDWATDETRVELWHPHSAAVDDVRQWRSWLERRQVRQPFKQAHREVYLLTDAERRTETYSNRFAAHILRQHQFAALCQQRGWRYRLQGAYFDSYDTPRLELPAWELAAEFFVEGAFGDADARDDNVSATGIHLYLATDQVRFYRAGAHGPLPLEQVPPLVFSEVMRDVDLFVGVCSVGNDPTWSDGGPGGAGRDYWREYSFGDLSESGKNRRQVLESLLPRLKIADRCSLEGNYLVVRGQLRTYKIHIGSGNILMLPNDQYLCIVPDRGRGSTGGDKVFLPFEGDNTLSVIISKALLLAGDAKIKDPTITRQIDHR